MIRTSLLLSAALFLAACNSGPKAPTENSAAERADPVLADGMAPPAAEAVAPADGMVQPDLAPDGILPEPARGPNAPAPAVPSPTPDPNPGPPQSNQSRATYACDSRETVEMRFFPDQGVAVLVRGGKTIELNSEPAASGIRYAGEGVTVTGKGRDIRVETAGQPDISCTAN